MGNHPFVMLGKGSFADNDMGGGGEQDVFEAAIATPGHLQASGSGSALFVGAAGLTLQADAAIFPKMAFGFEAKGGVEISQDGEGPNMADFGQFHPLFDNGIATGEFPQLFIGELDLLVIGIESNPEQVELFGELGEFLLSQPWMSFGWIFENGGGDFAAIGTGLGADAIDLSGSLGDALVVEVDPLFEGDALVILAVMDSPKESTAEQLGEFGGVDGVVFVPVAGDEMVASGVRDNELVDVGIEMAIDPAGQGGFFDGEKLFAGEFFQYLADGGDGGPYSNPLDDLLVMFNGNICGVAMHVGSDIIGFHDGSFRMGSFCFEPLYPRMPSFHIFRMNPSSPFCFA
jgi:hypothetical protein